MGLLEPVRAMYLIIWFRAREAVEMIGEHCAQGAERGHLLYCCRWTAGA